MKRWLALVAGLAVVALAPQTGVAQESKPPPPTDLVAADAPAKPAAPAPQTFEALPPPDARWRVLLGGLGIFGVSYGGMALMGGLWDGLPGADYLFIPVAGPWIGLGESGCAPGEETVEGDGDCDAMMGLRGVIYVVDGLLQLGGLGLIGQSIFMSTADPATSASVMPVPFIERDAVGLGVIGTF